MALQDAQKGFYDKRRYFQGKDDPDLLADLPKTGKQSGVPPSQLMAGLVILGLILLGFWAYGIPRHGSPQAPAEAASPPAAAH